MHKMSDEHLNAILQYLITKPYAEVHQLVRYLQSAEAVPQNMEVGMASLMDNATGCGMND